MLSNLSSNRLVKRAMVPIVTTFFIATSALVVGAHVWLKPSVKIVELSRAAMESAAVPLQVSQADSTEERFEAELITIRATGFEPSEITRPKGKFFLIVDNRSELEEVELRIDRVNGARLHNARVPREVLDWNQIVDLPPGDYILTEANHPEWACRIKITPR